MKVKRKEHTWFPVLCGMLIVMACCFRTGAVLLEEEDRLPTNDRGEAETYLYIPRDEEPLRSTASREGEQAPLDIAPLSMEDIDNRRGVEIDIEALMDKEISLALGDEPCVLILHTHGSEAYRGTDGYRSSDPEENVIRVGKEISQVLNAAGIPTVHDTTAYDLEQGYDAAYEVAAEAIASHLKNYPGIRVVIDVHRDAVSDGQGEQKPLITQLEGSSAAELMLVMGTDTGDLPHPGWQDNLAFALKLQGYLQGQAPGLMRNLSLRGARYNEHFTSCSLLLEVGSAGNTMEEALHSARYFGERLAELLLALGQ